MTAMTNIDEGFDWRTQGACDSSHADLAFLTAEDLVEDEGYSAEEAEEFVTEAEELAKAVCQGCPVRSKCLQAAMMNVQGGEQHGVWGGMTAAERAANRPAYLVQQRRQGNYMSPSAVHRSGASALHTNPGVDQRYQARAEVAVAILRRLRQLPEDWTLDTRNWLPEDGHYGVHSRDVLIELFDLIRMHPESNAKTLADGLGRSTSWFNSVTRSCRRELGIG